MSYVSPPAFRAVLWLSCSVAALALVIGLMLFLLDATTLKIDAGGQEVSTETTLGRTVCEKKLAGRFPLRDA